MLKPTLFHSYYHYLYNSKHLLLRMSNSILDLPLDELPVFDNKVGGAHTTPFFYTAISIMFLGTALLPVPLVGIGLSVPFFFSSSWAKVNVTGKKLCKYWKVVGIAIGSNNWQPLPPINAVTIIRVKLTQTVASRGSQSTLYDYVYKVQLASKARRVFVLLEADKREDALKKANEVAAALEVNVVDYTDTSRKSTSRRR